MARILKKEIEFVVGQTIGEDAVTLALFLKNKSEISEIEISEKIGLELNRTRSMLYKLHQVNLVKSTRKRDEEKGWYTYYWSFKPEMIPVLIQEIKNTQLDELKNSLSKETGDIRFLCNDNCVLLDFEHALNFNFKCPECGCVMEQRRVSKDYVNSLKTEIKILEKELK